MKKLASILLLLIGFSMLHAELQEVRGVLTQKVEDGIDHGYAGRRYNFKFTNQNDYSVWLEMELWAHYNGYDSDPANLVNTKSITLKAGESYIWKVSTYDNSYVKYKAYKKE